MCSPASRSRISPPLLPSVILTIKDVSGLSQSSGRLRINGLDSIRFILACWVAIGHIGLFPLFEGVDTASKLGWLLKGLYNASVNGPAAVIVFFVISGFCIHFPFRNGDFPRLARYYPRRYFRILTPL